jgi:hypothetical protein
MCRNLTHYVGDCVQFQYMCGKMSVNSVVSYILNCFCNNKKVDVLKYGFSQFMMQ